MKITTVSSKGQVVLPKAVREALNIRPGAQLAVAVEGTRVIFETVLASRPKQAWKPVNPSGAKVSTQDLCRSVELD